MSKLSSLASSAMAWYWPSRKFIGTIHSSGMRISIYSDSSIIGSNHFCYVDRPNTWFPTSELLNQLQSGTNIPFRNFLSDMDLKGEKMSELTIHSLTWAGSPKMKSFRFMTATVKSTAVPFPFLYLFRGDCVAILVVLHKGEERFALSCSIKKGSGWQNEVFAGMTADQEAGNEKDPEFLAAMAELKEEFGVLFAGLKVRRVGPPAAMSIGGCDEFGSPYVAEMEVDQSFMDAVLLLSSQYEDEKFKFKIEPLNSMVMDDSKKALCYVGYLRNPPTLTDVYKNSDGTAMNKRDLVKGLVSRRDELMSTGGSTSDVTHLNEQIDKLVTA
jgi:hypothetical protein